jgi:sporulation protein YlmC with PRC-barrel domain
MSEELDYRLGQAVVSSDDKHVGTLQALITDRENFQPRALVVKESRWFSGHLLSPGSALLTDEVAIPLDSVASVTQDRISLTLTGTQIRKLPPYLTYHYRAVTRGEVALQQFVHLTGESAILGLEATAAKSSDEIEISPGEHVMLPGGHKLGTVKELLYEGDVLIGVVLLPGGLFKQEVILPRRFLERGDDLALFASLTAEDVARLQPA